MTSTQTKWHEPADAWKLYLMESFVLFYVNFKLIPDLCESSFLYNGESC